MPTITDSPLTILIAFNAVISSLTSLIFLILVLNLFPQLKRSLSAGERLADQFTKELKPALDELKLLLTDTRRIENDTERKFQTIAGKVDNMASDLLAVPSDFRHKAEVIVAGFLAAAETIVQGANYLKIFLKNSWH